MQAVSGYAREYFMFRQIVSAGCDSAIRNPMNKIHSELQQTGKARDIRVQDSYKQERRTDRGTEKSTRATTFRPVRHASGNPPHPAIVAETQAKCTKPTRASTHSIATIHLTFKTS